MATHSVKKDDFELWVRNEIPGANNRSITKIFNFESLQKTTLYENLRAGTESGSSAAMAIENFDDIQGKGEIFRAYGLYLEGHQGSPSPSFETWRKKPEHLATYKDGLKDGVIPKK